MVYIGIFPIKKVSVTDWILVFSILAVGGFNEWVSAIVSVALLGYLIYKSFERKAINFSKELSFFAIALISVSYFVVSFWAIDAGMAFIGGIKFLPPILFFITLKQEKTDKTNIYQMLILATAVMVVVSSIFSIIPQLSQHFTVADRLAGFFQYPNAFAMLILISELLILQKEKINKLDIVYLAVFLVGIIYSGSRIVFVLFVISNIAILLLKSNKKFRLVFLFSVLALLLITFIFFKDNAIVQRFLRISIFESTFVGRILYWVDALPLLLKYPFGMGYLGYNYVHPVIQTGVYTVRYVHNDFLQLFLDIGWMPAIVFIVAIVKKIVSKSTDKYLKVILLTFCAHIFFDFDLQFLSMFLILIVLLEDENSKITTVKFNSIIGGALALFLAFNTYMSLHLVFSHFDLEKQAEKLYPWNTDNHIATLEKEQSILSADKLATDILKQNSATYIPYVIKARAAYASGDFTALITYNRELINRAPFYYENYESYARMLIEGIRKYKSINDYESANFCAKELMMVKSALSELPSKLSTLGKAIKDQPKTEFPQEISEFIDGLEE